MALSISCAASVADIIGASSRVERSRAVATSGHSDRRALPCAFDCAAWPRRCAHCKAPALTSPPLPGFASLLKRKLLYPVLSHGRLALVSCGQAPASRAYLHQHAVDRKGSGTRVRTGQGEEGQIALARRSSFIAPDVRAYS
jgi:hypothetical protein